MPFNPTQPRLDLSDPAELKFHNPKRSYSINIQSSTNDELLRRAKIEGMSFSEYCKHLLMTYFSQGYSLEPRAPLIRRSITMNPGMFKKLMEEAKRLNMPMLYVVRGILEAMIDDKFLQSKKVTSDDI